MHPANASKNLSKQGQKGREVPTGVFISILGAHTLVSTPLAQPGVLQEESGDDDTQPMSFVIDLESLQERPADGLQNGPG